MIVHGARANVTDLWSMADSALAAALVRSSSLLFRLYLTSFVRQG
jgi:hypothetical protein